MYEPDDDGGKADVPDLGLTHLMESRMRRKSHVRFGGGDGADQPEQSGHWRRRPYPMILALGRGGS